MLCASAWSASRSSARSLGKVPNPKKPTGLKPLRVLIVDDSENDALLLVRELKRGGYEPVYERVDIRGDGEGASQLGVGCNRLRLPDAALRSTGCFGYGTRGEF